VAGDIDGTRNGDGGGLQGIFIERDDFRAHGQDERLGINEFYEGDVFLYELVKSLAQPAP
jgi:acetylornithine deacetylase/succinyl-diaminopimelate desuccinylase-like protein